MDHTRELSAAIPGLLPYDGPHSRDTVLDAAESVSALVRYLNNATGPGNGTRTLCWAATVDVVVGYVESAAIGLDQLLTQLAGAMERHARDATLYDDRRDRPASDTAYAATDRLIEARQAAYQLADALAQSRHLTTHLGND